MLNEERVILMTKLTAYAKREGKRNGAALSYFRGDYVGFQVLKSILYATVAYAIIVAAYMLYHFDHIMQNLYNTDLMETAKILIKYYFIFTGVYAVISCIVFSIRYSRMRKRMKKYYGGLRMLSRLNRESEDYDDQ